MPSNAFFCIFFLTLLGVTCPCRFLWIYCIYCKFYYVLKHLGYVPNIFWPLFYLPPFSLTLPLTAKCLDHKYAHLIYAQELVNIMRNYYYCIYLFILAIHTILLSSVVFLSTLPCPGSIWIRLQRWQNDKNVPFAKGKKQIKESPPPLLQIYRRRDTGECLVQTLLAHHKCFKKGYTFSSTDWSTKNSINTVLLLKFIDYHTEVLMWNAAMELGFERDCSIFWKRLTGLVKYL